MSNELCSNYLIAAVNKISFASCDVTVTGMLSSRDQRSLKTKFNGLILVLGLVVVVPVIITIVLVLMHLGLVVSKFDYAKYLLLLAMVTYNSGL